MLQDLEAGEAATPVRWCLGGVAGVVARHRTQRFLQGCVQIGTILVPPQSTTQSNFDFPDPSSRHVFARHANKLEADIRTGDKQVTSRFLNNSLDGIIGKVDSLDCF